VILYDYSLPFCYKNVKILQSAIGFKSTYFPPPRNSKPIAMAIAICEP